MEIGESERKWKCSQSHYIHEKERQKKMTSHTHTNLDNKRQSEEVLNQNHEKVMEDNLPLSYTQYIEENCQI